MAGRAPSTVGRSWAVPSLVNARLRPSDGGPSGDEPGASCPYTGRPERGRISQCTDGVRRIRWRRSAPVAPALDDAGLGLVENCPAGGDGLAALGAGSGSLGGDRDAAIDGRSGSSGVLAAVALAVPVGRGHWASISGPLQWGHGRRRHGRLWPSRRGRPGMCFGGSAGRPRRLHLDHESWVLFSGPCPRSLMNPMASRSAS